MSTEIKEDDRNIVPLRKDLNIEPDRAKHILTLYAVPAIDRFHKGTRVGELAMQILNHDDLLSNEKAYLIAAVVQYGYRYSLRECVWNSDVESFRKLVL